MNVLPVILWGDRDKLLLKSDDPDFEWWGITKNSTLFGEIERTNKLPHEILGNMTIESIDVCTMERK